MKCIVFFSNVSRDSDIVVVVLSGNCLFSSCSLFIDFCRGLIGIVKCFSNYGKCLVICLCGIFVGSKVFCGKVSVVNRILRGKDILD